MRRVIIIKKYVITFLTDSGEEDVMEVIAPTLDAAANYSAIPYERIVGIEEAVSDVRRTVSYR